jgi:hypothetical protein
MPTNEQTLLKNHVSHAQELVEKVEQQFEALRAKLFASQKRAEAAEQSRDLIRAHAQAALDKYRAGLVAERERIASYLEGIAESQFATADDNSIERHVRDINLHRAQQLEVSADAIRRNDFPLKDVTVVVYSHENTPPGFKPCTRASGHDGPCALALKE